MLPPRGATPPQHTIISDISGYYERILTKFSYISLITRRRELGEKMLKFLPPFGATPPPHFNIGDISGKYEFISKKFPEISQLTRQLIGIR